MEKELDFYVTQKYNKNMKKKTKMGRPRKPKAEKYSAHVLVHMTQAERVIVERESKKTSLSLSALLMRPWRKEEKK
ncbi:MAG: hypothetical protein ABIH42_02820 [Planctomycetota bacterium]